MINLLGKSGILAIIIFLNVQPVLAQLESDSIKRILPTLKNEKRVDALISLASYRSYNASDEADSLLQLSQDLIDRLSYDKGQIRKWLVEATLSNFRSKLDQSDSLLSLAVRYSEELKDSVGLANAYMTFGTLHARRSNLAESIDYHIRSLKISRAISDYELECSNLMNIGLIKLRLGESEVARDFLLEGAEVATLHNFKFRLGQFYLNLGYALFSLGDADESMRYLLKSLEIFQEMDDKSGIARASTNLAFAYNAQGLHEKALKLYREALSIYELLEYPFEILKTRLNISKVYVSQRLFEQAIREVEQVLIDGREINDLRVQKSAYDVLLDIYEKKGDYQKALSTFKSLSVTRDSIDKRADKKRLDALVAEFESERKDSQLKLKNQQIELLEKEKEVSKTRQYLLALIVVLLLLSVVSLRYVYFTRLKRSHLNEQAARENSEKAVKKNSKLTGELKQKSIELQQYASLLADHQDELARLKNTLTQNDRETDITYLNEASRGLNRKDVELLNWQDFRLKFDQVHSGFVTRLKTAHPALTPREIDLCVLLKVSVPNTEISQILEITYDGVKKAIRRTYKKMALSSAEELRNYILQLN
ncbi:MAG: hypothetical protein Roseis2KO_44040 [Roseivirga sp.]